jgi:4-amino-4-deoxy-L-arabinose transferase-like glycosyltransferase
MLQNKRIFNERYLVGLLIFLTLLRLISLGLYPLADTTEARYAEIARLMFASENWLTPQIELGTPFWGKPPLSTWLSTISFTVFGINEFAARLPSFLLGVSVIALIHSWGRQLKGATYALVSVVVLATSAVFFISSGAVMTDPALLLGTTLSMVAFYRSVSQKEPPSNAWGYLFFVGLAISLLAKGPVGVVLTLLPIAGWVLLQKNWWQVWSRIPWIGGGLLAILLSAPWYLLAEKDTPGFLEYFFVGEHWKRFVDAGWKGDLYGQAHAQPRGTIWLYWLASALPWSLIVLGTLFYPKCRRQNERDLRESFDLSSYLVLWMIAPMVFFTLSGNILWTYVLPGMPAFAMLFALLWNTPSDAEAGVPNRPLIFSRIATGMSLFLVATLLLIGSDFGTKQKSQQQLVETYLEHRTPGSQLLYIFSLPHSAQFYSRGKAGLIKNVEDAESIFKNRHIDYFVVKKRRCKHLTNNFLQYVENIGEFNGFCLFREVAGIEQKLSVK